MVTAHKILVVDDEANIRLTFQEILSRDGYQVTTAATGQAALDQIAAHSFDLALIDLFLGDMSGIGVLSSLRQNSPDTVAIVLTAYASMETVVEALRQGAHDYLFKPCPIEDLRRSIRSGLRKLHQERQQRHLLSRLEQRISNSLASIQAVIAEQDGTVPAPNTPAQTEKDSGIRQADFVKKGELTVDFARHLISLSGHPLPLSTTEFNILAYLIKAMPRIVPPQELVRQVRGYTSETWEASETVRVHIYHIRRKVKQTTGHTDLIDTVRGKGYTILVQ